MTYDYFDQDQGGADRWSGAGTHHDRFVSPTEMLLIGVALWRATAWYAENKRRLSPQEQAEYNLEVERWENYLLWESQTPGAREAREAYVANQIAQERRKHEEQGRRLSRIFVWRPVTLIIALMISTSNLHWGNPYYSPGYIDWGNAIKEWIPGLVVWVIAWAVCIRVARSYRRVITPEWQAKNAAEKRLKAGTSNNLPILWRDANRPII